MAQNAIVYESRNRLTGTLMRTIDTRHQDAAKLNPPLGKRPKGQEAFRYAAQCVDHKVTVFFQEHYPAGRAIAHSGDSKSADGTGGWCAKCVEMVKLGKKVERPKTDAKPVTPAATTKTSTTKRTSDKKANRQAQRKAAEAQKPSEVTTRQPETLQGVSEAVEEATTRESEPVGAEA